MKGRDLWSYAPYRPPMTSVGDIYVSRIAPSHDSVHLEWHGGTGRCTVYCRVRDKGDFKAVGESITGEADVTGLECGVDHEFFVADGNNKSLVRLARTGEAVGVVVNYLHPDDGAYAFSGRYLCSPSLVKHPDGYLLASMDLFESASPQNLTLIFRSDDGGDSWHYVSELMPCFWGKMFIHKGELYMLSCSTEYGDLLIGKSTDGGRTFSAPVTLLRGSNGKRGNTGVHKNPQNVVYHGGRLYTTLEWGSWHNKDYGHAAMVMSCEENADLLSPESWSFTEPLPFDRFSEELDDLEKPVMTIEGTLAVSPEGELLNVMRFGKRGYVIAYKVNTEDPEAPLSYKKLIRLDTTFTKFTVRFDEVSECYFTIVAKLYDGCSNNARNLLSLMVSRDLDTWDCACDLYDLRGLDARECGMQYVDFDFDGDDIIYLSRTALNGAHNYHDANYQTFHRISNFRKYAI